LLYPFRVDFRRQDFDNTIRLKLSGLLVAELVGVTAQWTAANPVMSTQFDDLAQWQAIIAHLKLEFVQFALNREWHEALLQLTQPGLKAASTRVGCLLLNYADFIRRKPP
jgi:hypothetical protein